MTEAEKHGGSCRHFPGFLVTAKYKAQVAVSQRLGVRIRITSTPLFQILSLTWAEDVSKDFELQNEAKNLVIK